MTFNRSHPEQMEDELFCMNIPEFALEWVLWETKRLGDNAYDNQGKSLSDLRPLFVKKEEVLDRYGVDHAAKIFGELSSTKLLH